MRNRLIVTNEGKTTARISRIAPLWPRDMKLGLYVSAPAGDVWEPPDTRILDAGLTVPCRKSKIRPSILVIDDESRITQISKIKLMPINAKAVTAPESISAS